MCRGNEYAAAIGPGNGVWSVNADQMVYRDGRTETGEMMSSGT